MIKRKLGMLSNVALGLILVVLAINPAPIVAQDSFPMDPSDPEIEKALDWLRNQQEANGSIGGFGQSAWVVNAIVAAGEDPHDWGDPSIVEYLGSNADQAATAADYERMILAIAAAGEDPSDFGGRDFVELLKDSHDGTQFGNDTQVNDDFWGVMAYIAAGGSAGSEIVQNSVSFIKDAQQADGGWAWAVTGGTSVDSTGAAIMALIAAGESPDSTAISDGLDYLKDKQDSNGGFLSWGATNADTDSRAINTIVATGQEPTGSSWSKDSNTPVADLLGFQQDSGQFYWQSDKAGWMPCQTTASAIQALLGVPYPVLPSIEAPKHITTSKHIINYASIEDAVEEVRALRVTEAARILGEVRKERAGEVLNRLDLGEREEIVLAMSSPSLKKVLTEVDPEKLYEISSEDLFSKLPDVPVEQLVKEMAPEPCSDITPPNEIEKTSNNILVKAPELRSGEWVNFFDQSSLTFTSLSLKSTEDLKDVKASLKTLIGGTPAGVRWPSHGSAYKSLFFDISLENIESEEIGAIRVTFELEKDSLEVMSHHKWSILLNRWDEAGEEWISIPTKRIDEDSDSVYYSAVMPGSSSIFCITGSQGIPAPKYEFSNLSIAPGEVTTGDETTISCDISNLSEQEQSCPVTLWINKMAESCQEVEVPAGEGTQVSFTVQRNDPGEYGVRIGRLMGGFTVKQAPDQTPPEISYLSPNGVVRANPSIEAGYSDIRPGVDENTVKLLLDGEDVTSKAEVSQSKVTYTPIEWIEEGKHTVEFEVSDLEGNKISREWDFTLDIELRLPGQKNIAGDLDGDGLYEDVNGDVEANLEDRYALFRNLSSPVVRRKAASFDFNGDGIVDVGDVFALPTMGIPSSLALVAGDVKCEPGELATAPITIYHAESGVSAFSLKISLKGKKLIQDRIIDVDLPDYGISRVSGNLPGQGVMIHAVDLKDSAKAGMMESVLAEVKVKGSVVGTSDIEIDVQSIYDEQGEAINPAVIYGEVQIIE